MKRGSVYFLFKDGRGLHKLERNRTRLLQSGLRNVMSCQ
jgi:hypothetical protein